MQNRRQIEDVKESNFFGRIIYWYLPYWPLFLFLMILAGAGAWFYLRFATPLYEVTAKVLIKDENKGAEESKTIESLDMLSSKKIIENEIEVFKSRTLMDEVVRALNLSAPIFEEDRFRTASAYISSPVTIQVQNMVYQAKPEKFYFTYDPSQLKVNISGKQYPLNEWISFSQGSLRFIHNKRYRAPLEKKPLYFILVDPKSVASDIVNRLNVSSPTKLSSMLNLSLKDEVPERGEDIMNELLITYNKATINDKNTLAANTLSFVEDRLKSVEHDLDSIEKKIQTYKAQTGAIDISTQGKLFLQNVSTNDQKLSEINMQLAVLNELEIAIQSANRESGMASSTVGVADPSLAQLVDKLNAYELEYESLKKTTAENHPLLISLTDKINKIKPGILENIQNQRKSLLASRANLATTNGSYSSVLRTIPKQERELIDINREQNIKNGIYSFLLQKREEAALSHGSTVPDSRVIDRAQASGSPVSPKKKVIYLSALLLALFSGIGVVTAKESLSNRIIFRKEIEKLTQFPIIGEISSEKTKSPVVIAEDRKTFVAEQFRRIRATFNYIGINSKRKRIMVTSSIPGEGKSFVALNLAISIAITGKRVALVDFDLNNPSISKKLDIPAQAGVTEYLLGEAGPEQIIYQTEINTNLCVIPTGKLPHNPTELITNGRAGELLDYLDTEFDYIVVDTAPVGPVTDAYLLSPYCYATIFVVRHKYTPRVFVERIDEDNKLNKLNNLAIVFNGVRPRGFGSKKYGYGYGYGYHYAYNKKKA